MSSTLQGTFNRAVRANRAEFNVERCGILKMMETDAGLCQAVNRIGSISPPRRLAYLVTFAIKPRQFRRGVWVVPLFIAHFDHRCLVFIGR